MKKLLLFTLLFMFVLSTSVQTYASVSSENTEAQKIVDKANQKIDQIIHNSHSEEDKVLSKFESGKISLEEKDVQIETIITKMLTKTNKISHKAVLKVAKLNILVQCTYVEVIIDQQVILVDPLIIIGT